MFSEFEEDEEDEEEEHRTWPDVVWNLVQWVGVVAMIFVFLRYCRACGA
jgi:hypothetical protein